MKIFIDTNIFLDLLLNRKHSTDAKLILNAIQEGYLDGFTADITLLNIDYVAKKQIKDIRSFLNFINNTLTVVGADNNVVKKALDLDNRDFEDNVQATLATLEGCKMIITNDHSFVQSDVQCISSSSFVDEYLM